MPKILMQAKINKPYDHWVKIFDADKGEAEAAAFSQFFRGHELEDPTSITDRAHTL